MVPSRPLGRREIWVGTYGEADLALVAETVAAALGTPDVGPPFCLWLLGGLGAGKTTLTGWILRHFGLPEHVPVTSPTYTYMNEYQIGKAWYAHLDLYRARAGLTSEDLGLADARPFAGIFAEWPEQLPGDPNLVPSHVLEIVSVQAGAARTYTLYAMPDPLS